MENQFEEQFFEMDEEKYKRLKIYEIIAMIGLIITMIVVGIVVWYYGSRINTDVCLACKELGYTCLKLKGG